MTTNQHPVTEMLALASKTYKGDELLIAAACKAHRIGRESVYDAEEAAGLIIDAGWTWREVLDASS